MSRILTAALVPCLCLGPYPGLSPAAAADRPLSSFIAPPGQDDDRPRPVAAPRPKVEVVAPRPAGMMSAYQTDRIAFTLACTAAAAALAEPGVIWDDGCPAPFLVLAELP
jgi:hypothetical protein